MKTNYKFHITLKSSNAKVGKIPVSTSSENTCPSSCPLKGKGCYAGAGPLALHWKKMSNGLNNAVDYHTFIEVIKSLPAGQIWRHNQAGDLMGEDLKIDSLGLIELVNANKGKKGYTYTHKTQLTENHDLIKKANKEGFTINLSADNLNHADKLKSLNIGPVVVVLPINQKENLVTPAGNKVVVCPATQKDNVSCSSCQLCQKANRSVIVGFPAHGTQKKKAEAML